jgi:hypothetical protein
MMSKLATQEGTAMSTVDYLLFLSLETTHEEGYLNYRKMFIAD